MGSLLLGVVGGVDKVRLSCSDHIRWPKGYISVLCCVCSLSHSACLLFTLSNGCNIL
jgi:hypothetical protein